MLLVEIQALRAGPVRTDGSLAPDDPLFEGVPGRLEGAVAVTGTLATTGEGRHFWRGHVRAQIATECRRCLAPMVVAVDQPIEVLYSTDREAADDPSAYPLAERATTVDLRPAVREELILAAPLFPLCREYCRGLCPRCGTDLNTGPCECPREPDPRSGALLDARPRVPDS